MVLIKLQSFDRIDHHFQFLVVVDVVLSLVVVSTFVATGGEAAYDTRTIKILFEKS